MSRPKKRKVVMFFYQFVNFSKFYNKSIITGLSKSHRLIHSVAMEAFKSHKVYVTRRIPVEGVNILSQFCEVTQWDSDEPVPRDVLLKNVQGKDGIFCLLTDKIDQEVISKAGKSLKVVGTMSVGYDHLDVEACKSSGVVVGYTPDVLTDATAELTVSLLLTVSRRLVEGVEAVKSGEWGTWSPLWMCGQTLSQSTVGIVGLGRIGLAVAKRLQPFGVNRFLYTGHSKKSCESEISAHFVSMNELLEESDFVVVTCALTPETQGMFDQQLFSKMKKTAIFVNTSRGGIVNQDDLYYALKNRTIAAAGLDVITPEPLPLNNPLLSLSNCVVLPHIGSATLVTRTTMAVLCAKNIVAALTDKPMPAKLNL